MIIVDKALAKRAAENNYIQAALVGAGEMGKGILNQLHRYTPGIRVALVYNRTLQTALDAFEIAGIENYRIVETVSELESAIKEGFPAITQNLDLLYQTQPLDVLIEATGSLKFAAQVILRAIEEGKHVLSFNAELDGTLGPLIAHKARQAGVKYTVAEGDQPGCTLNLFREVKMRGFEPLVAINIKGMLDQYRTPKTQEGFAAGWGMSSVMATNFADGTKVNLEQAVIANAIGFRVNQRGMNGFKAPGKHMDELTHLYDVEELKANGGIVDFIIGGKPGPGVCVYATAQDSFTRKYLKYGKLGEGPLYSFYIPYHLLFFEIGSSVARLVDFNDMIVTAAGDPKVEVISLAKTDLTTGDLLDGIGGFMVYGECENYSTARSENLLPVGLAENAKLLRDVPKNGVITLDDIEFEDRYILELYQEQCALFPTLTKANS